MEPVSYYTPTNSHTPKAELEAIKGLKSLVEAIANPSDTVDVSYKNQTIQVPVVIFSRLMDAYQSQIFMVSDKQEPLDEVMTTQQLADFLGYSRPFVVKLLNNGQIPHTRIGKHRRILRSDAIQYLEQFRKIQNEVLTRLMQEDAADGLYDS